MKQYVGGQAVIEGVMMRSSNKVATAVRKLNGKIVIKKQKFDSVTKKNKLLRIPIIRGFIFLIEMTVLGMKTLMWSAEQQSENDEEKLSNTALASTIIFALLLSIGLFVLLPYFLTWLMYSKEPTIGFNLIDGVFRLVIFVLYIVGIGMMSDVKRLFQYHGAEHKTVNCYEAKQKLTVGNVKKYSVIHPRCGTSLIVFIIFVSIVVFSLIKSQNTIINVLYRVVLIPLIAGIGYETTKLTAIYKDNLLLKYMIKPGLWTQRLTTKEPDNKQIEVAIAALNKVL